MWTLIIYWWIWILRKIFQKNSSCTLCNIWRQIYLQYVFLISLKLFQIWRTQAWRNGVFLVFWFFHSSYLGTELDVSSMLPSLLNDQAVASILSCIQGTLHLNKPYIFPVYNGRLSKVVWPWFCFLLYCCWPPTPSFPHSG